MSTPFDDHGLATATMASPFTECDSLKELEAYRRRQSATGGAVDCFRIWIALPQEGLFEGPTVCIHERTVVGPPGTVERFAARLDKLVAEFQAETSAARASLSR